jgi:hypothetical protein
MERIVAANGERKDNLGSSRPPPFFRGRFCYVDADMVVLMNPDGMFKDCERPALPDGR